MSKKRQMNRRKFLELQALGTMGLIIGCKKDEPNPTPEPDPDPSTFLENYTKAIVIGSGFGGAVSALRLGQAGIDTKILERGKRWPIQTDGNTFSSLITPDKRSAWLETESIAPINPLNLSSSFEKHIGVLERVRYPEIDVYTGACVGGGSVVYGGITIAPEESLFSQVFPAEISYSELKNTYFPRVIQMLNARPIPADLRDSDYFQFTRVGAAHAENIGLPVQYFDSVYDWDIIKSEIAGDIPPSAIAGEIIYGVNSGAKKSLDQNYLPAAEATGFVEILVQHQVRNISQIEDGYYQIEVELISESGEVLSVKNFHCQYLFMGAGSLGTTRLLMRAKAKGGLSAINDTLGQGWGSNGATMASRSGLTEPTGQFQSSPSSSAVLDLNNPISPTVLDMANLPLGFDCNCLIHLGLSMDSNRGNFVYDTATDDVLLNWTKNGVPKAAIEDVLQRLNAANGGTMGHILSLPETRDDLTYHPLGGAVMGETCDFFGRVKGYDKLYVMDGALIPGSTACANPSLTIAGIAERNIEKIILEDIG